MTTHRSRDTRSPNDHTALWRRALWPAVQMAVFQRRNVSHGVRASLLRAFGARIGDGVVVGADVRVRTPWHLTVDGPAWIGDGTRLTGPVRVGRDACVATGSLVSGSGSPTRIGNGAWVGPRSRVLPGAAVGAGATLAPDAVVDGVVADDATVTGPVPPGTDPVSGPSRPAG